MSHKVPGCKGTWIRIGTLVDPDAQMCGTCKGRRRALSTEEETEVIEVIDPSQPPAEKESGHPSRRAPFFVKATIIVVATAIAAWFLLR